MPVDTITLDEFEKKVKAEMEKFFTDWRAKRSTDELQEIFPFELTEEEWWDQLLAKWYH